MPMTMTQMLGLMDDGTVNPESNAEQKALEMLSFLMSAGGSLEEVRRVRQEPGERFITDSGNEPGKYMVDVEDFQKTTDKEPTEQGWFDSYLTDNVAAPKGVAQRGRLTSAMDAVTPAAFMRGGQALTETELSAAIKY